EILKRRGVEGHVGVIEAEIRSLLVLGEVTPVLWGPRLGVSWEGAGHLERVERRHADRLELVELEHGVHIGIEHRGDELDPDVDGDGRASVVDRYRERVAAERRLVVQKSGLPIQANGRVLCQGPEQGCRRRPAADDAYP